VRERVVNPNAMGTKIKQTYSMNLENRTLWPAKAPDKKDVYK